MSIATQIERLQGVRDQIRTKMVSLGLSENTDLLQNLADDLDGVNKVSPTNNGTTDPGSSYTNVDTLSRSTSTRYIKVPKGYNDADRKFTVSGVANGSYSASVASHTTSNATASSSVAGSVTNIATTTAPSGTDGTDYYTITPKLTTTKGSSKAKGKATISTAGYIATGNTTSSESSVDVGVTATQGDSYYLKASSVTKEDPGTSYANKATVTPSTSTQYVKVTAGYLPNSKITVEAIPNQKGKDDVTATVTAGVSDVTSINASQVTDGVTVTASASGSTVVPVGYYSTQVSKTPRDSKSTTIKPKLAGTSGSIELTAGTSAFTKTSTADYSNGFITSVKVNPTPSEEKTATPSNTVQTVTPAAGKLLSKVTVNAIPSPYFNTSGVTATAGTVLKDYKFVNSSGTTVTGTIATATSSNVSGSVSGGDPGKITLTAAKTSGSSSTTATAKAIVTKGLYTGSSNIEKDLTSKTFTATAEATLAGTNGAIELTAGTSAFTKTSAADYSNGFITSVKVNPTPSQSKSVTPTIAKQTVSPDTGKLLSSVTVNAVPSFSVTLNSGSWQSDSNVTIGKYYYNVSNTNITASNNLYVMPDNASAAQSFGVYAYSQDEGTLQFRAVAQPTSDLTYTVYYLN